MHVLKLVNARGLLPWKGGGLKLPDGWYLLVVYLQCREFARPNANEGVAAFVYSSSPQSRSVLMNLS